jgi:chemotaxis signal transduction protein
MHNMFANTVSNKWVETQPIVTTIDLIVFEVDRVSFGIPMTKIARIISSVFLGEDYSLTQNVEILDLHCRLTGESIVSPTSIVLWIDAHQQIAAIPIETVPIMVSVPLDRIRTLPHDFRQHNPLGIASHIATIAAPNAEATILILAD